MARSTLGGASCPADDGILCTDGSQTGSGLYLGGTMLGRILATCGILLVCNCGSHSDAVTPVRAKDDGPKEEIKIAGIYTYERWDAEERGTDTGVVRVELRGDGEAYYEIRYNDSAGVGVGVRRGEVLSVSCIHAAKGKTIGGLFVIAKDRDGRPALSGRYTAIPGNRRLAKLSTEKWTFKSEFK
jgi:hypothetical protein